MSFCTRSTSIRFDACLVVGAALFLASPAAAQTQEQLESIYLSAEANETLNSTLELSADHPEPEWSRLDVAIGGEGVRCIASTYDEGDVDATRRTLDLAKEIAEDVLASTGAIGLLHQQGGIAGMELDVLPNDPGAPPMPSQRLPLIAVLEGYDGDGVYGELGVVYLYDQAQLQQRLGELSGAATLGSHTIWLGSVLWAGSTTYDALSLYGTSNRYEGGISANGSVTIGGEENCMLDPLTYAGAYEEVGSGCVVGEVVETQPRQAPAPPHAASWYQAAAQQQGQAFTGDVTITAGAQSLLANGSPVSGIVYATGRIDVTGAVSGSLTLVSEAGVTLGSGVEHLTAAADQMLAMVVGTGSIEIACSDGVLTGELYAAQGGFELVGSNNLILGRVVADTVLVTGGANLVSDGTY